MSPSSELRPEPTAGQTRASGAAVPTEPDDRALRGPGCSPLRFCSKEQATRDALGVLVRGPHVARAYAGGLDSGIRERVMVAVSQANQCRDCARMHRRWALRAGVSESELDALRAGEHEHLDPRSRAAVCYAVDLAQKRFAGSAAPEASEAAREHLSARELNQVEAIARAMTLANLTMNTLTTLRRPRRASSEQHPLFARYWSRISGRVVSHKHREELLAGLQGRVLEVGAGDGRNFAHYPPGVTEVFAVEPEPYLRRLASDAALAAPVRVTVLDGTAERLPLDGGSCHSVVSSLVLCSVSDQRTALAELYRVLLPGGELRFLEHVIAEQRVGKAVQAGLDGSGIWPQLGAGCHLTRDTVSAITATGFKLERIRRFTSGPGAFGVPFVLGMARRHAD